jgi:hypothetical protein
MRTSLVLAQSTNVISISNPDDLEHLLAAKGVKAATRRV